MGAKKDLEAECVCGSVCARGWFSMCVCVCLYDCALSVEL